MPLRETSSLLPSGFEAKQPLSSDTLLKVIRSAPKRANITNKSIRWHSFRHSLATNLRAAIWIVLSCRRVRWLVRRQCTLE